MRRSLNELKTIDITNEKFGRLTPIRRIGYKKYPSGGGLSVWECKCDCGNTINVNLSALRTGNTKSCGCIGKELLRNRSRTHGQSHSRLNEVWKQMKKKMLQQKCT